MSLFSTNEIAQLALSTCNGFPSSLKIFSCIISTQSCENNSTHKVQIKLHNFFFTSVEVISKTQISFPARIISRDWKLT